MKGFTATLHRDLMIAYRRKGDFANPLIFFLIVCSLFPLGLGPNPQQLALMAPGILWVVALLAAIGESLSRAVIRCVWIETICTSA